VFLLNNMVRVLQCD